MNVALKSLLFGPGLALVCLAANPLAAQDYRAVRNESKNVWVIAIAGYESEACTKGSTIQVLDDHHRVLKELKEGEDSFELAPNTAYFLGFKRKSLTTGYERDMTVYQKDMPQVRRVGFHVGSHITEPCVEISRTNFGGRTDIPIQFKSQKDAKKDSLLLVMLDKLPSNVGISL